MNVSLTPELEKFVDTKVDSGLYNNASEVVREAMRQYMHEDERIEALRAIIRKSLSSGPARPFDWDAFIERKFGAEGDA